jgi:hypothetical protein
MIFGCHRGRCQAEAHSRRGLRLMVVQGDDSKSAVLFQLLFSTEWGNASESGRTSCYSCIASLPRQAPAVLSLSESSNRTLSSAALETRGNLAANIQSKSPPLRTGLSLDPRCQPLRDRATRTGFEERLVKLQ